jgi:hypothetical protein
MTRFWIGVVLAVLAGAARADAPGSSCKFTATIDTRVEGPSKFTPACEPGSRTECHWNGQDTPMAEVTGSNVSQTTMTASGTCKFSYKDNHGRLEWRVNFEDRDPKSFTAQYVMTQRDSATGDHADGNLSGATGVEGSLSWEGRAELGIHGKVEGKFTHVTLKKTVDSANDGRCTKLTCERQETPSTQQVSLTSTSMPMDIKPTPKAVLEALQAGQPFTITATGFTGNVIGGNTMTQHGSVTVEIDHHPRCGPDATAALRGTVKKIKENFATLDPMSKNLVCSAFYDPVVAWMSWDLHGLHAYNEWTKCGDADCARPDVPKGCYPSIAVDGGCYYTGSVNYVMLGVYAKLCGDTHLSLLNGWTFQFLIDLWKVYYLKLTGRDPAANYETASAWAKAGYDGWPDVSAPAPDRSTCAKECSTSFHDAYPFGSTVPDTFEVIVFPVINGL